MSAANWLQCDEMSSVTGCTSESKRLKQPAFIHSLSQESSHGAGTWSNLLVNWSCWEEEALFP